MQNDLWHNLICNVHQSEHQAVLAITGGGSGAISQLLQVPGGSSTVLEAVVPYASTALADWLGTAAEQSCSESTARAIAMASWMRSRDLAPDADQHKLVGLGATASLVSDRPKRGEHRVHVATQTATHTSVYSLVLAKGQRERTAEETLTSQLILVGFAEAIGVETTAVREVLTGLLKEGERIETVGHKGKSEWTDLLLGQRSYVGYQLEADPQAIFPGAFNPPHAGHQRIFNLAAERLGCRAAYEISITNVDKPPLDFIEIEDRLHRLKDEAANDAVVLTDAPTFRRKSELFPGSSFIVGADTIARVGDPKYYTGAEGSFDAAIQQIADAGCRFLVFGRELNGKFRVLSDIDLPPALQALCEEVTAEEFREDVSSTELRSSDVLAPKTP